MKKILFTLLIGLALLGAVCVLLLARWWVHRHGLESA
mgnify:CR=1 FL=1